MAEILSNTEISKLQTQINDWMIENTGAESNECSCTKCQNMCKVAPCLATPVDVINLIQKGHGDKFMETIWGAGLLNGIPIIEMLQLKYEKGKCILFENGKCLIHEDKPLEGKLANCKKTEMSQYKDSFPPAYAIALMWNNPAFEPVISVAKELFQTSQK